MTLSPGTTLGPYAIVSQLGSGGMGVVYTATDPRLDHQVEGETLKERIARGPLELNDALDIATQVGPVGGQLR